MGTVRGPEARPATALAKLWATPIACAAGRRRDETVDTLVEPAAREEVRAKLSRFIRSRWFEPPFGGEVFTGLLLEAFLAMEKGKRGPRLIPNEHPLDLSLTVPALAGHPELLSLNPPPRVKKGTDKSHLGKG